MRLFMVRMTSFPMGGSLSVDSRDRFLRLGRTSPWNNVSTTLSPNINHTATNSPMGSSVVVKGGLFFQPAALGEHQISRLLFSLELTQSATVYAAWLLGEPPSHCCQTIRASGNSASRAVCNCCRDICSAIKSKISSPSQETSIFLSETSFGLTAVVSQ